MSDYADEILCSMVKNVGNSVVDIVEAYAKDGTWTGGEVFSAGMEGNYIGVAYGAEDQEVLVPQDIIDELDQKIADIQAGKIVVDTVL